MEKRTEPLSIRLTPTGKAILRHLSRIHYGISEAQVIEKLLRDVAREIRYVPPSLEPSAD